MPAKMTQTKTSVIIQELIEVMLHPEKQIIFRIPLIHSRNHVKGKFAILSQDTIKI